ncbi:MAG: hypothetical protein IPM15_16650 [Betaproteobacteria bacterium]|nr:hypothetical protein [Betaproteobacteria bacterium]MCC6250250.1 hypothetical protein [Rubrivivax sp.]MCL4696505.1 hypothetical protein [Burkholderiaceae bacterium]
MRRRAFLGALALLVSVPASLPAAQPASPPAAAARAPAPAPRWREFPFALKLDIAVVDEVVGSAPPQLLAAIASHDVDVLVIRGAGDGQQVNPLLAGLREAQADLLRRAEFLDGYEGRVVLRGNPSCEVPRDTILVRETALSWTLLHEFLHTRLRPVDECRDDDDPERGFALDHRRFVLYQRRLYDDPFRLLEPLWRRDILDAQAAVAGRLFRRIQIGQAQEAIVEKVLRAAIGEHSPYDDAARRARGVRYGELMIDNAIDMFNSVEAAVAFVQETARHLRDEVRKGRIAPAGRQRLDDDDLRVVEEAGRDIAPVLARVRAEIVALKKFYVE